MEYVLKAVIIALSAAITLLCAKYYVHMLQLEGYFLSQYLGHLFARIRKPSLLIKKQQVKKPLVFTGRVKRLYVAAGCIVVLYDLCVALFFEKALTAFLRIPAPILCFLPIPLVSVVVLIASVIMLPVEKAIKAWYINDARRRLKERPDLNIIAITGSYGKTSTKFILSTILSEKYACLTPPASYNTTMGVVRVIRERLQPDDRVFICEMGSRHIGDIKEICDIVHPHKALITSIGPQHLDTFGSIEGVKKGKFELIEALPENGTAVFSSLNEHVLELYEKTACKKLTAGFLETDTVRAENISVGCFGSAFTLVYGEKRIECTTRLLGKHNISNILVSAAMAIEMGLTLEEIQRGISKIMPIEHRLQIVSQRPVTVIDDAFNSSPNGAAAALDVLGNFVGRRIIITPGFVELGKEQDSYHFALGEKIRDNADIAILVGKKRTEKIKEGIGEGFKGTVYTVSSLEEATKLLNGMALTGDVVLFENDLPDNFNE